MTNQIGYNKECAHGFPLMGFCIRCHELSRYLRLTKHERNILKEYRKAVKQKNLMILDFYLEEIIKLGY